VVNGYRFSRIRRKNNRVCVLFQCIIPIPYSPYVSYIFRVMEKTKKSQDLKRQIQILVNIILIIPHISRLAYKQDYHKLVKDHSTLRRNQIDLF